MRKYLFIGLLFYSYLTTAQKINRIDSVRIQFLKEQLVDAKGKIRVDVLNGLAGEYQNAIGSTDSVHRDSVYKYASSANAEAKQINYEFGIAFSLFRLARYHMKYLKDSVARNNYWQQAFVIAEKIKSEEILGWYYYEKWELKKAYQYFKAANNKEAEADAVTWLCYEYSTSGKFDEEGFKYCQRAIELADIKKTNTPSWGAYISQLAFITMSDLFNTVGDYEGALTYLRNAFRYAKIADHTMDWDFGRLFMQMAKYDSSLYYFERALQSDPDNRFLVKHTGTANLLFKNYDRAAQLLEKALSIMQKPEFVNRKFPVNWKGEIHLELAESYEGLNKQSMVQANYKAALEQLTKEYNRLIARSDNNKSDYQYSWDLLIISKGLSKSFYAIGKHDSAYLYLNKHNDLKDSIQNRNLLWRLNMQLSNYKRAAEEQKRSSQINLLNKDNQIKDQKLKQQAFVRNSLLTGILLLFLLGVFIFRILLLKRKNEKLASEKTKAELQQKVVEMEMHALRAQMNPHFIFNCLSSINRYILKNEPDTASDYLTRFSRLIRMVLINSQKSWITLEDELEMLTIYLDMERLRFRNTFNYHIVFTNRLDAGAVLIPPMLLQPFCENAIWHGLKHLADPQSGRQDQGRLDIELCMDDKVLICTIMDNGIGREKAAAIRSKSAEDRKSMGLKITTDRLALLNGERGMSTHYEIEDLANEKGNAVGTKVILKISYKESVEEVA